MRVQLFCSSEGSENEWLTASSLSLEILATEQYVALFWFLFIIIQLSHSLMDVQNFVRLKYYLIVKEALNDSTWCCLHFLLKMEETDHLLFS